MRNSGVWESILRSRIRGVIVMVSILHVPFVPRKTSETWLIWGKLISTILDFPYPTIALLTGHTFGAGCLLALAHDYRITSSAKRYFSIPAIDLGLSFPGMGVLPRLKLTPQVARKMLLEAHRWTPDEALRDGVVDLVVAEGEMMEKARWWRRRDDGEGEMMEKAKELAGQWKVKAKAGVYGVLRNELWGDAGKAFREISFVHNKVVGPSMAKIWN
jgi:enoyl-CoA hydratase/carnithine racemase